MTNKYNSVFYIGVTSDIVSRIWEHINKVHPNSFTAKYNCTKLVYYQSYPTIEEAITAEKLLKGSNRAFKKQLVSSINPEWRDLYEDLFD